jgi:hypothetical protein
VSVRPQSPARATCEPAIQNFFNFQQIGERRKGEERGGKGGYLVQLANAKLIGDDDERGEEVDAALNEGRVDNLADVVLCELTATLHH